MAQTRPWAAGTAHMARHARHAAAYALKAVTAAGDDTATEQDWQYQRLPEHLRAVVFPTSSH
ncbi:MAG: putative immunity protein [Planctomycetota bacterium]